MKQRIGRLGVAVLMLGICGAAANEPPVIRHQSITAAVRSQPISVMARVTDDAGPVKYVTLFYSLSRDAAPFRVPMKASDADLYVGTIPPDLLADVDQLLYYIEAMDADEATQETSWYTIQIRNSAPQVKPVEKAAVPAAPSAPPPRQRSNLVGVGLIAGGAAAVAGAALYVANKDDNSSSDDDSTDYAGVYQGSATECFALSGQSQNCTTRSMAITIGSSGSVQSSDLREASLLTAQLNKNKFVLRADLAGGTNGVTGEIFYEGTVVDGELFGRITGSYQGPDGTGFYSGSFDGTRAP